MSGGNAFVPESANPQVFLCKSLCTTRSVLLETAHKIRAGVARHRRLSAQSPRESMV